jgi:hypothetical protein
MYLFLAAIIYTSGCINARKTKTTDKRTREDIPAPEGGDAQPVSPGGDNSVPDGTDPTIPGNNPPTPDPATPTTQVLSDGLWQVERVTCGDGAAETLESIWTYEQRGSVAAFTRKLTGGCQKHQDARVAITGDTASFTPGATRCDGACPSECTPLTAGSGTTPAQIIAGPGGVVLKTDQALIADFCTAKLPAEIFLRRRATQECEAKWSTAFGNGSLQVLDGFLRWHIPAIRKLQSHELTAVTKLSGDFTVELAYSGLEATGRGAFFKLLVRDSQDARYQAFVMAGNYSPAKGETPMHLAAVVTDGNFIDPPGAAVESRSGADGTMTIEKRGQTVTVKSGSQGDSAAVKTNPGSNPFGASGSTYDLILAFGSNSNLADVTDVTSVNIDYVTIKDAAGKQLPASDGFDCPSIRQ